MSNTSSDIKCFATIFAHPLSRDSHGSVGPRRITVAAIISTPGASPDETAVRNIIQEEIADWNSGDAVAYASHFAADGTFTNIRGQFFVGRQAFIRGMTASATGTESYVFVEEHVPCSREVAISTASPEFLQDLALRRRRRTVP